MLRRLLALRAVWFVLLMGSFASPIFASQEGSVPSNAGSAESAAGQGIERISVEMTELIQSAQQASGDEREALQLRLFQKNLELREQLARAIEQRSVAAARLIELLNEQVSYAKGSISYLDEKIKAVNSDINQAKDEDKLALVNNLRELQQYLYSAYQWSWQNLEWSKQLDVPDEAREQAFRESVEQRMSLLSASIEYLNQQSNIIGSQVSSSPESEKAALQLSQLILKQRLTIATDGLRTLVALADKEQLETSEYKRQIFEVTGSITYDLLNSEVAFAIISNWSSSVLDWLAENAPQHIFQLLVFVLILFVARAFAKLTRKMVGKAVSSKNLKLSQLMQDFFISMSGKAVWVIGIMVGLSQIGLNLTPILTGFGIAGVIIGFALQDTLSNFAAGMMLLIYRPFDVGDFVYAGGVDGKVSHMSLVNTTIRTFDNQIIIVPNSKIWGDVIKNVTHERIRRVDMVFGIGYGDDLLKAEAVLNEIVDAHKLVLATPEPNIKVHTLNTSSVDFIVRPWVKTDDYWDVYWDITKEVKLRFDREGISIPFPQQDVHLHMAEGQLAQANKPRD